MNPSYDFTNQVALVTGAGSGMGLATARAFAENGAAVVLADINPATVKDAGAELARDGHQALGVECDVANEHSVTATVRAAATDRHRVGRRRWRRPVWPPRPTGRTPTRSPVSDRRGRPPRFRGDLGSA